MSDVLPCARQLWSRWGFFSSPMRKLGSFRQEIDYKLPGPDPSFELCPIEVHRETCKDAADDEMYMAISTLRSHKCVVLIGYLLFQLV